MHGQEIPARPGSVRRRLSRCIPIMLAGIAPSMGAAGCAPEEEEDRSTIVLFSGSVDDEPGGAPAMVSAHQRLVEHLVNDETGGPLVAPSFHVLDGAEPGNTGSFERLLSDRGVSIPPDPAHLQFLSMQSPDQFTSYDLGGAQVVVVAWEGDVPLSATNWRFDGDHWIASALVIRPAAPWIALLDERSRRTVQRAGM